MRVSLCAVVDQGRSTRRLSRATQTNPGGSPAGGRPLLPYVVVTAPSPDERRPEPTLMMHQSAAGVTTASPGSPPAGRGRPRLSAISATPPDPASPTTAGYGDDLPPRSPSDLDAVDGRPRSAAHDGRPSNPAGNRRVTAADGGRAGGGGNARQRDEQAAMQELLRELGVDSSSVDTV